MRLLIVLALVCIIGSVVVSGRPNAALKSLSSASSNLLAHAKIRALKHRASHKSDAAETDDPVPFPSALLSLAGTTDSDSLATHLLDGAFSTATIVDGSTQLIWTSSKAVGGDSSVSELPLSIHVDARVGKDGTGYEMVFDVTPWMEADLAGYTKWLNTYSALSEDKPSRTGTWFKLSIRNAALSLTGESIVNAVVEFATGPDVGNPSTDECESFASGMTNQDMGSCVGTVNNFLATASNDLPSTTLAAVSKLLASEASLSSHSVRTNCFWIDSFLSIVPLDAPTAPTPPDLPPTIVPVSDLPPVVDEAVAIDESESTTDSVAASVADTASTSASTTTDATITIPADAADDDSIVVPAEATDVAVEASESTSESTSASTSTINIPLDGVVNIPADATTIAKRAARAKRLLIAKSA